MGELPLSGILVAEISQGLAGPLCGLQLASLGASVIKIEPPGGDWLRRIPPPAMFEAANRCKMSTRLDFSNPSDLSAARNLLGQVDVVIVERLVTAKWASLSYERCQETNPMLIWAEVSPFGEADLGLQNVTELTIQMGAGLHRHLGGPQEDPVRPGYDIASMSTSLFLFTGIMSALYERLNSGKGQEVSVSMLGSMASMLQWNLSAESQPDEPVGVALTAYQDPPDHGFVLRDGAALFTFQGDEDKWYRFFIAVNRPELAADERFGSVGFIRKNMVQLKQELNEVLKDWTYEQLHGVVTDIGGSIVPFASIDKVLDDVEHDGLYSDRGGDYYDMIPRPWAFSEFLLPRGVPLAELPGDLSDGVNLAKLIQDLKG